MENRLGLSNSYIINSSNFIEQLDSFHYKTHDAN